MNEEVKETALKLSDYTETINKTIRKRLFFLTIIAFIGMIAFVTIEALGLDTPNSICENIVGCGLRLNFGILIVIAMYLSGILTKIKERRMMRKNTRNM